MKMLKGILETIYKQAEEEAPLEACGYLAGKEGVITTHYKMTNADQSEIHYSFDPQEQFRVIKTVRNSGLEIIAAYHSHPESPARPSEEDIRLAHDSSIIYVIVSLESGKRTCGAFIIKDGSVTPEPLEVI
jgi:proteasome lid subunit RPN8/RPN11